MGAPAGNQNAAKAKLWSAAIERALERMGDPSIDPDTPIARTPKIKALDLLADQFVSKTADGDLAFFREFGDRIEGKPAQAITGDPENPLHLISEIRRTVIDPKPRSSDA